jgi:hypothetical protein
VRRVVVESPYAGDVDANIAYARRAIADCLSRGEAPIASHLLFTQPGVLDDDDPDERELGIASGLAWHAVADAVVFYVDRGWSSGMLRAKAYAEQAGATVETRTIDAGHVIVAGSGADVPCRTRWGNREF